MENAFHYFRHCKFGSNCHTEHILQTCTHYPCPNRHPRPCRYFVVTGYCKFQETCSFSHRVQYQRSSLACLEKKILVSMTPGEGSCSVSSVPIDSTVIMSNTVTTIPVSKINVSLTSIRNFWSILTNSVSKHSSIIPKLDGGLFPQLNTI